MAGWLLVHLLLGAGGAWMARRYALRRNLIDQPGERRSHGVPTPRTGGLGIVFAGLLGGIFLMREVSDARPALDAFLVGFAMVAAIGLADDHRPLSPWLRLAVHFLAAILFAAGVWMTWHVAALAMMAFALAMVLTNVWNFMDGIDGIATTQAMLVAGAVAIAVPAGWVPWLAVAVLTACLGFLPFNFPKARLFLGDVGSGSLGFALAALLVFAVASTGVGSWAAWLLLPSAFLVDASLTLGGRVRRGEAWWRPHALHAYQRWSRSAGSHVQVTLAYAGWTVTGCALFLAVRGTGLHVMLVSFVAWYMAGAGVWWALQGKHMRVVEDRE